ncbi:hypothetical protein NM688_g8788 [Phlebia brevispora]|uniref:Uncharacterized protein n=1 Tax=Phlebia brevispora TaxID=194682 RepID=A0ACC1RPC3_9APHY|nr:hypothetical protein NM688_g8788 [Phlebia brevispora]
MTIAGFSSAAVQVFAVRERPTGLSHRDPDYQIYNYLILLSQLLVNAEHEASLIHSLNPVGTDSERLTLRFSHLARTSENDMFSPVPSIALVLSAVASVIAWGDKGHQSVGYIAELFLRPKAKLFVNETLGPEYNYSLGVAATWADTVKTMPAYAWSADLHYVNAQVTAIANYTARIADTTLGHDEHQEALKFLVCNGMLLSLHTAWDIGILDVHITDKYAGSVEAFADALSLEIRNGSLLSMRDTGRTCQYLSATAKQTPSRGTVSNVYQTALSSNLTHDALECPLAWAREANAWDVVFNYKMKEDLCSGTYYRKAISVISSQIASQAYRLAMTLNSIFDPDEIQSHNAILSLRKELTQVEVMFDVPNIVNGDSSSDSVEPPILILDGGLGTTLEDTFHLDISTPLWSAKPIDKEPEVIIDAHLAFLRAGARIILTATYQCAYNTFKRAGYSRGRATHLMHKAVRLAQAAKSRYLIEHPFVQGENIKIALSLGPFGGTISTHEFDGIYPPPYGPAAYDPSSHSNTNHFESEEDEERATEALKKFHLERLRVFASDRETWDDIDWIAFETVPLRREIRAIRRAMDELRSEGKTKPWPW